MKNSILILSILCFLCNSSCKVELLSCLKGEGNLETQTVSIDAITGVEIGIEAEVVITEGEEQRIEIKAHPNVIDRILSDSKIQGETWEVDLDGCSNIEDVEIFITLPEIKVASIKGSGSIITDGVFNNIEKINLEIDGDGKIDFKLANVTKVDTEIKGSGTIIVSGTTTEQSIDISGDGTLRTFDLMSENTRVEISGDGDCEINVNSILEAIISGTGRICYRGTPDITFDNSGDGTLENCN